MATLSLDFSPVSKHGPAKVPKPLTAVGSVPFEGPHSFVAAHYFLSHRSAVFRGRIRADEGATCARQVVCKYREEDIFELEREAKYYRDNLRELQGIVVPCFYGLYKGTRVDEYGREWAVACLILEHCPTDRSVPYWKRPLEIKEDIAYGMLDIHSVGLRHTDFDDDHVLVSEDGQVRIIDFDQAAEHKCNAPEDINVWGYEQSAIKFGCNEMRIVIKQLDLWTPMFVELQGTNFLVFSYPTPELLAEGYLRRLGRRKDQFFEEKVRQEAKEAFDEYYAKYGERFKNIGYPEDIKRKLDASRSEDFKE